MGCDADGVECLLDPQGQVVPRELLHRQIHAHGVGRGLAVRCGPALQLPARFRQYPRTDLDDDPRAFGDRNELRRRNHPALRVRPTQQRLHRDDALSLQRHDRLIVQCKLAPLERAPELRLEGEPAHRHRVHGRVEDLEARPSLLLRAVHRRIGAAEQPLRRFVWPSRQRDADAGRREELDVADVYRRAQAVLQPFGDPCRVARVGNALQEQRELVATKAREHVAGPEGRAQTPRRDREQLVASVMAVALVHRLEVVEVDEQHRTRVAAMPPSPLEGHLQSLHEEGPVRQTR